MSDGYGAYETLKLERQGGVGWLINNRPEALNAMNALMRDEFAQAPGSSSTATRRCASSCTPVRAGRSRPGSTSQELASDGLGMERYRESASTFDLHFTSWHQRVAKPVITAVNGLCAGGAFHWVADADIVIAASDAQFFDPHVSVGQVVAHGGDRPDAQDAVRGGHADGARRPARADVGGAGVCSSG